ncbi:hypothetical protein [Pantoea ananatis]|uniref:hypothetical protein n=1 Tax=Pantoea ananas TaxID=553 RepID=UPI00351D160A
MSKVMSSDALNVVIKKGLVRTANNYFSNEPVEAYKQATSRIRNKQNRYLVANPQEKDKQD